MASFQHRSHLKELLDGGAIPFAAIKKNMAELNVINHLLGGHRITLKGVRRLLNKEVKKHWHIVEIGCGGGDNLRVVKEWASRQSLNVTLTGIDINKECIAFAESIQQNAGIQFVVSDYRAMQFKETPDIVFSSLFCHHFSQEELVTQLQWMLANSTTGFFINDLHRHPLAYYSIKMLTAFFSKSYLVRHDAPLSVLRGFEKKEWQRIFEEAGLQAHCQWQWAFRWLIINRK